jgi:hypothetical protein
MTDKDLSGDAVELVENGCSVPPSWPEAIRRGFETMGVEDVTVVVTTDFARTVAQFSGASTYNADRGGGVVGARTMYGPDGPTTVLNSPELASRPAADVERLLAHEAGHVIVAARRNEEMSGYREDSETDWEWTLKCVGGLAMIEYRIEKALVQRGYPPAESTPTSDADQHLYAVNAQVVEAVLDPANADPSRLHDRVVAVLDHATKLLAYIAASVTSERKNFDPAELSADGKANWSDYVASTWERRLGLYNSLPPVTQPITPEQWRAELHEASRLEMDVLRDFGFAFANVPGDGYSFNRVATDVVFTRRLERALRQMNALER